ncbi:MAG TPA: hypothetical protein VMF67_10610 [Rhizomicrobium sp.]|nr:hypothetical protein [Rhizomicrobium sp.]
MIGEIGKYGDANDRPHAELLKQPIYVRERLVRAAGLEPAQGSRPYGF